jgi:integrase
MVKTWWGSLPMERRTGNAHAYGLLRTIMGTAVEDEHVAVNPCHIKGAGQTKRQRKIETPAPEDLPKLAAAMPEQYRAAVYLAAWCALRFGELAELRRMDVDTSREDLTLLHVDRAMTQRDGRVMVGTPKSDAGRRTVTVPEALRPMLLHHLEEYAQPGRPGLLFTAAVSHSKCGCDFPGCVGGHLAATTLHRHWKRAREAVGRPELRWHDLRHAGAVWTAQEGATLAELMSRLGHSTPAAAMRYQHAAQGRDAVLARGLSGRVVL